MVVMGVGHLFCVPDTDDVKQKNNSLETIPSRYSLNRKQRKFTLALVFVSHACTKITVSTFTNDLVLVTGIMQC